MNNWQPIETAPKDGDVVLLVNAYGYLCIAHWDGETFGGQWSDGEVCYDPTFFTHWMRPELPR